MPSKTVALTGISSDNYDEIQDAIASAPNFHPETKYCCMTWAKRPVKFIISAAYTCNVEVISFPLYLLH